MTGLLAQANLLPLYKHVPVVVFVFAFGGIVGSFINVVIYRLPAGMSVISPPSRCPTCGARLKWWENMPILGWFIIFPYVAISGMGATLTGLFKGKPAKDIEFPAE